MHRDTVQAALWAMRAMLRELESRAANARADGLAWEPQAREEAGRAANMVEWLEYQAATTN